MEFRPLAVFSEYTETDTLTLAQAWEHIPAEDCSCAVGPLERTVRWYRIQNITRKPDMSVELSCLEYDEAVYEDEGGTPNTDSAGNWPGVSGLSGVVVDALEDGIAKKVVSLSWRGYAYGWKVFYKRIGIDTAWTYARSTNSPSYIVRNLEVGYLYRFAVTPTNNPADGQILDLDYQLNTPLAHFVRLRRRRCRHHHRSHWRRQRRAGNHLRRIPWPKYHPSFSTLPLREPTSMSRTPGPTPPRPPPLDQSMEGKLFRQLGQHTWMLVSAANKTWIPLGKATAKYLGQGGNDTIPMTFHWNGQEGQPEWLWGGNDGANMYVYNPANFSVNYATSANYANSAGSAPANGGTAGNTTNIGGARGHGLAVYEYPDKPKCYVPWRGQ